MSSLWQNEVAQKREVQARRRHEPSLLTGLRHVRFSRVRMLRRRNSEPTALASLRPVSTTSAPALAKAWTSASAIGTAAGWARRHLLTLREDQRTDQPEQTLMLGVCVPKTMYGRRPRCKREIDYQRSVRVRSCIRPLNAAA